MEIIPFQFEGIELSAQAHEQYEFVMTTKEVAEGYGVGESVIREHKRVHADELIEGKHFITCVRKTDAGKPPVKSTLWTKRGVIRLGFYIKSDRAILFRDCIEDLVIEKEPAIDSTLELKESVMTQNKTIAEMAEQLNSAQAEIIESQKQIIAVQEKSLNALEFALKLTQVQMLSKPKQLTHAKSRKAQMVSKSEHKRLQDMYSEGMKVREIAETTGWAICTVKRHVQGSSARRFDNIFQGGL